MELKRAAEFVLCDLLKEQLSDLTFLTSKGGGNDVTPDWEADHNYFIGDILRPTNHTLTKVLVVESNGNSGSTEPSFDDVVGSTFGTDPLYQTVDITAISTKVNSGAPLPPFAVVIIDETDKTMHQEDTSYLLGRIQWVTRADATNVVDHSLNFERIYDALTDVGSGYDILRRMIVHGVDVLKIDEYVDEARQAHGDHIFFRMGVTHKPSQD